MKSIVITVSVIITATTVTIIKIITLITTVIGASCAAIATY